MGRRERELDPAEGPVARFALELRKLRDEAGPLTYRQMALRAHYSTTTLAQAAAGERLPSLPVALAYVRACGGDEEHWERRWVEAEDEATAERLAADGDDASAPYRGLARFETSDSGLFFGRDRVIAPLAALVAEKRFTVLCGPSGSGKSSLLRAGLIPRLRRPGAEPAGRPAVIRVLTPGPRPATAHAEALSTGAAGGPALIVVDQFEELFTLCADPAERARFVDGLLDAARSGHGHRVLIAIRADFYGHLAQDRRLADAAGDGALLLGPMNQDELRESITGPAAARGLLVERALTARIIDELGEQPGSLPLMSHALLETWRRRHGRTLTEAAYVATGGLAGAIARTAEDCYEGLTPAQRETVHHVLLRLVTPGLGTQDTRRPVTRAELGVPVGEDTEAGGDVAVVLERLGRARLVTLGHDTVDLAHEALLTAWPRLRGWIDEDRERLRLHRRLTEAAAGWQELGGDPGALYRGARLSAATESFGPGPADARALSPLERRFLAASTRASAREQRTRRLRGGALSVLLVLALLASLVAWQQNRQGERRRVEDEARRIAGVAESLRLSDPVTAMRLGLAAWQVADLPETRAALLAASAQPEQGLFTDPDTSGDTLRQLSDDGNTLLSIGRQDVVEWDVRTGRERRRLPGVGEALDRVAPVRGDGPRVLEFSGGTPPALRVTVRGLAPGATGGPAPTEVVGGATTGAGGRLLVTYEPVSSPGRGVRKERATVRDAATGAVRLALPPRPWREPRVGESLTGPESAVLGTRRGAEGRGLPFVQEVFLSPDGSLLARCLPGEPVQLWDLDRRRRLVTPWAPTVPGDRCVNEAVRFTPDSKALALTDGDGVRTWDVATGRERRLVGQPGLAEVRFSPDGRFLAAVDHEKLYVWRVDDPGGDPVFRYALGGEEAAELRFDLATGSLRYLAGTRNARGWPRTVRTLDVSSVLAPGRQHDPAMNAEFSPSGTFLAVARGQGDRAGFRIRDLRPGGGWSELPSLPCPAVKGWEYGCQAFLAFSPDSRTLVYGTDTASAGGSSTAPPRVVFWDIARRRVTGRQDLVLPGKAGQAGLGTVAYTPDGRSLLLVQPPAIGTTYLWDPRRRETAGSWPGAQGHTVATAPDGSRFVTSDGQVGELRGAGPGAVRRIDEAHAVAFSPDGSLLAAGDGAGRVVLWDGRAGRRLGELKDRGPEAPGTVVSLAFSPDSRLLAVGGNGSVEVWDMASRTPLGPPLATGGEPAMALGFGADGTTLRVAGRHVDLATYRTDPGTAAATVCRRANGHLPEAAWRTYLPDVPFARGCPDA
ncbi:hypothetical protein EAO73_33065 [Streptomyces sp. col6]|uniref:nSTAND1 domain-containing NTPase n=1 Tax=Streptomyces sp. col6 TaxID=2478958 RepID=UPI0011CD813F|nr:hypothetical protein [Streptomyces sp. col6]TXR96350.1 hypothetical protein EAO73_33065 [Streptomyces sp. col6]